MPDRQDRIDSALREAMSAPPPALSARFDQRLTERLRPRRLSMRARVVLFLYALLALLATAWCMRDLPFASVDWRFVILLVLVPLSFLWTLRRLQRDFL
jgi:hypothetical protein